ncbi:phosphoglucomutase-2 [Folsomia candida]|uniref:Phosphoglucomutase-2 n=1 Tax=Folsomia candida TaxID=158441 RepID=A0A226E8V9_FOLCA|nr:phosphoglucomutase-2 [Folsomia candida]OXA53066.1 Phosphoglucomutase-2 [Folsomia candida]
MAVRFPEEEKLYKVLSEHANYGGGPKNSANCDENGEAFQLDFLQDKPLLAQRVQEYMAWDKNPQTLKSLRKLIDCKSTDSLSKVLETRLQFGTAGLRGVMGAGFNAMNDLVIIQTTQGFLKYLQTQFKEEDLLTRGVVIGYDARHGSLRFATLAANVFAKHGTLVYLYPKICPTPWVPYAVTLFKCCAGIMVTASHNPKDDNGYKVYWENGAQIISPHDKGIQAKILENLKPWEGVWDVDADSLLGSQAILDPYGPVFDGYYGDIIGKEFGCNRLKNELSNLKIAYTPMHGVGLHYMQHAFQLAGLKPFYPVNEQAQPDPDFPTVRFPNPEEGKSALNLSIQTANREGCTLILANDPDADRLAVAEKLPSGEWKIFNGNEIGALLGWWCLENWKSKNGTDLRFVYMIASTVSSKILTRMSDIEGFMCDETLTGFKWMGNLAYDLKLVGRHLLFAFEEAIGFMVGTTVLDKDGISAGLRVAEMAVQLEKDGLTLNQQLIKIYEKYGFHTTRNGYFLCHEPQVIVSLFDGLRSMENGGYPTQLANGKYKITRVRDLTTGFDSGEKNQEATLPTSKGSQMITFYFDNGLVATLRTSGTEPKIKYYTELCGEARHRDWDALKNTLNDMVDTIIRDWIEPTKWGLLLPPTDE